MDKTLFVKMLALAEILLFASIPLTVVQHVYAAMPDSTPITHLKEENRSSYAQFKSHDATYLMDATYTVSLNTNTEDEQSDSEPTGQEDTAETMPVTMPTPTVQPAVESIAITKAPEPTPEPSLVHLSESPKSLTDEQITFLGQCEAGMDPTKNTGNGYYGAFQFSYGTWKSMNTGYERADLAPLEVQIDAVQRLLQRSSIYTQFPACARKMQSVGLI